MDEKLVTILLFEIQSNAFVFFNLQSCHFLILNLWRILFLLHVVREEKVIRKGVGNVTKKCLRVALPVAAFLEMVTKSVNSRATATTRTGCVRHGVGHQTPFSRRGSRNAAEDLRPNILQLKTEGLTAGKISVIEQQAYKNNAFIIVLQETHCTTADKLVIPGQS